MARGWAGARRWSIAEQAFEESGWVSASPSGARLRVAAPRRNELMVARMTSLIHRLAERVITAASNGWAPPSAVERDLAERLRCDVAALPGSGEQTESVWTEYFARISQQLRKRDPRGFLTWDVVRQTMFFEDVELVRQELDYLKRHPAWRRTWSRVIRESRHGRPRRFLSYAASSGNLIHHAYHVAKFQDTLQISCDRISGILEFGGGYGGMCRLWRRLGFSGPYVIFDLPPFSALQRYYLNHPGVVAPAPAGELPQRSLNLLSNVEAAVASTATLGTEALFLATWSLSESPLALRARWHESMGRFKYYLIAYQHTFGELANHSYFAELRTLLGAEVEWHEVAIDHMPGNSYLFGRRRRSAKEEGRK